MSYNAVRSFLSDPEKSLLNEQRYSTVAEDTRLLPVVLLLAQVILLQQAATALPMELHPPHPLVLQAVMALHPQLRAMVATLLQVAHQVDSAPLEGQWDLLLVLIRSMNCFLFIHSV